MDNIPKTRAKIMQVKCNNKNEIYIYFFITIFRMIAFMK